MKVVEKIPRTQKPVVTTVTQIRKILERAQELMDSSPPSPSSPENLALALTPTGVLQHTLFDDEIRRHARFVARAIGAAIEDGLTVHEDLAGSVWLRIWMGERDFDVIAHSTGLSRKQCLLFVRQVSTTIVERANVRLGLLEK